MLRYIHKFDSIRSFIGDCMQQIRSSSTRRDGASLLCCQFMLSCLATSMIVTAAILSFYQIATNNQALDKLKALNGICPINNNTLSAVTLPIDCVAAAKKAGALRATLDPGSAIANIYGPAKHAVSGVLGAFDALADAPAVYSHKQSSRPHYLRVHS